MRTNDTFATYSSIYNWFSSAMNLKIQTDFIVYWFYPSRFAFFL